MSSSSERALKEGKAERAARVFRNLNAIGAVAAYGAGIALPALGVPLTAYAAWNAAQAGALELGRRHLKKRRLGKAGR
jgi:hypothetical protein